MSAALVAPRAWPNRRAWALVALVFIAQLGLIFWLGDRVPLTVRPATQPPTLQLAGEASTELLGFEDPTLFALPHREGFSGLAWLEAAQPELRPRTSSELPHWLLLSPAQLGAAFSRFVETNQFNPWRGSVSPDPGLTLPAEPARPEAGPEHSRFRFEGDLARRRLTTQLELPPWPHAELLSNSVVQIVVDADGRPVSVLLLSGSGSKEADAYALDQCRAARFGPADRHGPDSRLNPLSGLSLGEMVFEWRTLPLPPANSPSAGP